MALGDCRSLVVCSFLMLLIMAVICIDQIAELAELLLQMYYLDLGIVEVGTWMVVGSAWLRGSGRCPVSPFNW